MSHRIIHRIVALAALTGAPLVAVNASSQPLATRDTAVFAGGCFWGVQAVFERVKGVVSSTSGYAGGTLKNPSYEDVSTGSTGHAESVRVIYDPSLVNYDQLLAVFFAVAHDPTELNYQGPDHGTQYRSAIFFTKATQQQAAQAYVAKLTQEKKYKGPIVTQIAPLTAFYQAEAYHQGFYDANPNYPYIVYNDKPKVAALKLQFAALYNGK